ncbi:hypothetical protein DBR06_SOUSAS310078 [Sousa chinensis]|uniref:Uncharacterized protein n=1 Tax=Sousa chinensis TaxID=103600 RepID=A0A484GM11_SOUCH|nr:hypothetical protein DBR06_SOUSAS310078 [Sousa chinensis]
MVVQQLRLCAPNAGGPGSIPGRGTRPRMPTATKRAFMPQLKYLTWHNKDPKCRN